MVVLLEFNNAIGRNLSKDKLSNHEQHEFQAQQKHQTLAYERMAGNEGAAFREQV